MSGEVREMENSRVRGNLESQGEGIEKFARHPETDETRASSETKGETQK